MPDPDGYAEALKFSFEALKARATERGAAAKVELNDNKPAEKAGGRRKSNG